MKKFSILILVCLVKSTMLFSQQLITVQKADTALFFTNIDSAMFYAATGDFIYLPGGTYTPAGSYLTISKQVNIIGTGHYPDSTLATGQTVINGNLVITTGADGGSVQGIYLTGIVRFGNSSSNNTVNGFSFSRCYFAADVSLTLNTTAVNPSTQNIYFSENVFGSSVYLANAVNVLLTKNIFNSHILQTNGQVSFLNNNFVFGYNTCGTHLFHHINGSIFINNIFLKMADCFPYYGGNFTGNAFYNNMFSANITFPWVGNIGNGNIVNQHPDSIFVNAGPAPYTFTHDKDYHLKSASPGINSGTDGTDIGIYGTAYPYKEGAVPLNPHIQFQSVAPSTDSQGNLGIYFKVAAQSR